MEDPDTVRQWIRLNREQCKQSYELLDKTEKFVFLPRVDAPGWGHQAGLRSLWQPAIQLRIAGCEAPFIRKGNRKGRREMEGERRKERDSTV